MTCTHDVLEIFGLLLRRDNGALDQKLVFTFGRQGWFLLHGLEHHCELPSIASDTARSWGQPDISILPPGSILPELGRTQYS